MALRPLYCGKADMGKCFMEKKTQKILKRRLFFSFCMERKYYCVTVRLWRPCWIEIIYKNNVIVKMEKRKNYIPYAPVGRVGTTKIKDTTVFAEDMYILYKQYL